MVDWPWGGPMVNGRTRTIGQTVCGLARRHRTADWRLAVRRTPSDRNARRPDVVIVTHGTGRGIRHAPFHVRSLSDVVAPRPHIGTVTPRPAAMIRLSLTLNRRRLPQQIAGDGAFSSCASATIEPPVNGG